MVSYKVKKGYIGLRGILGLGRFMENRMEKSVEHEMETVLYMGLI